MNLFFYSSHRLYSLYKIYFRSWKSKSNLLKIDNHNGLIKIGQNPIFVWFIGITSIFYLLWSTIHMWVHHVWICQHSEFFIYSPLLQTLWTLIVKSLIYLIEYYACLECVRYFWSYDLIHLENPLKILKLPGILEMQPRGVSWRANT